ncbi:DUF1353 domain-containing protein [Luteolibacter sp. GHJ8]|uniref:DUF1353 domain-containing protein n=2 Tax=Luteolibacter rhizosphaerae TaxID=2989719 RepID=A0ABT3GAD2_9BACT|nr:DUF1353 domain-containing protein [Luteolibacter rhizosphaerae]
MLIEDLSYKIRGSDKVIIVPAGFVCDRASIPGVVRPYFEKNNKSYEYPAIIHDWLYWNQYPKEKADDIFYNAMEDYRVSKFDRALIWAGVKIGGKGPWMRNKEARDQNLPRIVPKGYWKWNEWPSSWPTLQKDLVGKGVKASDEPRQKILY